MKCYRIVSSGCPTSSVVGWMAEREGPYIQKRNDTWEGWAPLEDVNYTVGANTWQASGPLTKETEGQLKDFWIGTGSSEPLSGSHVIGVLKTQPWIDTVVDQTFVDAMHSFDDRLFSFVRHERVWDRGRNCPPWEGDFFIATLLPLRPSFDLSKSDLVLGRNRAKRFEGSYVSSGSRRVIKASSAVETPIWRDAYTREVMCTEEGRIALEEIGISEWSFWPRDVVEDRH